MHKLCRLSGCLCIYGVQRLPLVANNAITQCIEKASFSCVWMCVQESCNLNNATFIHLDPWRVQHTLS